MRAGSPLWTPDGKWIAYASDETGNMELYVRPYPNVDSAKWQISNGGGSGPHWREDSGELVYVNRVDGTTSLYSVVVETEELKRLASPTRSECRFVAGEQISELIDRY